MFFAYTTEKALPWLTTFFDFVFQAGVKRFC